MDDLIKPSRSPAQKERRPLPPHVPHTVAGRFRVLSLLGSGAVGDVTEAFDLEHKRLVALKILRRDKIRSSTTLDRFFREAEMLGRLDHPGVVEIFASGTDSEGVHYLAMELIKGLSLQELVDSRGKMAAYTAARLGMEVCEVLQVAHNLNVVHRDLKPANLILPDGWDEGVETIKIVDFGVAKVFGQENPKQLTMTGQPVGTPQYMAPEQVAGQPVDGRTDLYSLGCILYYALSGYPPIDAPNPFAVYVAQVERQPIPIDRLVGQRYVPRTLGDFVQRLLSKSPDERPVNAAAAEAELRQFIHILPRVATTEPVPSPEEFSRPGGPMAMPGSQAPLSSPAQPAVVQGPSVSSPNLAASAPAPSSTSGLPRPLSASSLPRPRSASGMPRPLSGSALPAPLPASSLPRSPSASALPAPNTRSPSGPPRPLSGSALPAPVSSPGLPATSMPSSGLPAPVPYGRPPSQPSQPAVPQPAPPAERVEELDLDFAPTLVKSSLPKTPRAGMPVTPGSMDMPGPAAEMSATASGSPLGQIRGPGASSAPVHARPSPELPPLHSLSAPMASSPVGPSEGLDAIPALPGGPAFADPELAASVQVGNMSSNPFATITSQPAAKKKKRRSRWTGLIMGAGLGALILVFLPLLVYLIAALLGVKPVDLLKGRFEPPKGEQVRVIDPARDEDPAKKTSKKTDAAKKKAKTDKAAEKPKKPKKPKATKAAEKPAKEAPKTTSDPAAATSKTENTTGKEPTPTSAKDKTPTEAHATATKTPATSASNGKAMVHGKLRLNVKPEGAEVYRGTRFLGAAPIDMDISVSPSAPAVFLIRAPRHKVAQIVVEADAIARFGAYEEEVELEKLGKRPLFEIELLSRPEGADVFEGEKFLGLTPLAVARRIDDRPLDLKFANGGPPREVAVAILYPRQRVEVDLTSDADPIVQPYPSQRPKKKP